MLTIHKSKSDGRKIITAFLNGEVVDSLNVNSLTFYQAKKYMKSLYRKGAYENL